MTAAHIQPSSNTRPPTDTTIALRFLFGRQVGYIEVGYIAGDPLEDDMRFVPGKRWHRYSWETAPAIARFHDALAEQHGDVYVSSAIYSEPRRSRTVALPSRIVFTDDAPERPRVRYSAVCRTSAASQQSYHILAEAVGPATRRELQGLTAASGDKSCAYI